MQGSEVRNLSLTRKVLIAISILLICYFSVFDINGINGIVPLIQESFNINDAQTAVIKTATSIANSMSLVVIWIFGDSFDRRKLLYSSITMWIAMCFLSLLLGSNSFAVFVLFRALAAAAISIFGVLAQVLFADLFQDRALGVALMLVAAGDMFASMITQIVSSWIVSNNFPWQSGLTIGPLLSIPPLLGLCCCLNADFHTSVRKLEFKSILAGAVGIFTNVSFLLFLAGNTLSMFHRVGYIFFFPSMLLSAFDAFPDAYFGLSYTSLISLKSTIMMVGTAIGLALILFMAQSWYHGTGPFSGRQGYGKAYPIVVSTGLFLNGIMFVASMLLVVKSYTACLVAFFFVGMSGAAEMSLGQQMLLMIVPSSSRASAVALSRLVSGTVSIPAAQVFGMISDAIRGDSTLPVDKFHAYQVSLLISAAPVFMAALCNAILAFHFQRDCQKAFEQEKEKLKQADEQTSLVDESKYRSGSILEGISKSRATTLSWDNAF